MSESANTAESSWWVTENLPSYHDKKWTAAKHQGWRSSEPGCSVQITEVAMASGEVAHREERLQHPCQTSVGRAAGSLSGILSDGPNAR